MAGTAKTHLPPHSDRVLAAALEAAAVLVVVIDPAGVPVWVNKAATEVTGFDRETLLAGSILERIAPEQRAEAEDVLERLWRGDLPSDYMHQWIARDGRRIRIRWRFSHLADDDAQVTHIVGVGIDITRQHMLGQARRAAEERFRLSFDGAPVGMAVVRADEQRRGRRGRGQPGAGADARPPRGGARRRRRRRRHPPRRHAPRARAGSRRGSRAARPTSSSTRSASSPPAARSSGRRSTSRSSPVSPDGRFFLAHALDITDRKRAQQLRARRQRRPADRPAHRARVPARAAGPPGGGPPAGGRAPEAARRGGRPGASTATPRATSSSSGARGG